MQTMGEEGIGEVEEGGGRRGKEIHVNYWM